MNQVIKQAFTILAEGLSRGVSFTRFVVYRVCDAFSCKVSDILQAFHYVIPDEVDIISISLVNERSFDITSNSI